MFIRKGILERVSIRHCLLCFSLVFFSFSLFFGFSRLVQRVELQANTYYMQRLASKMIEEKNIPVLSIQEGNIVPRQKPSFFLRNRLLSVLGSQSALSAYERDNVSIRPEQTFSSRHLSFAAALEHERLCLAKTIYYEARSESSQGQIAVAEVVLNRVRHSAYPNTICKVVYQGSRRKTGCQFSFTCDGALEHKPRGSSWRQAQKIATAILLGDVNPLTYRATHYHTKDVQPKWSGKLIRTATIGHHIFYRFPERKARVREI